MKRLYLRLWLAIGVLGLLTACGGTESQLEAGFAKHYNKPLCIDHFVDWELGKYNLQSGGGAVGDIQRYLRASVPAWISALLDEKIIEVKQGDYGDREFTLTNKGRKYAGNGHQLCYGKTEFVKLLDYTDPVETPGIGLVIDAKALIHRRVTESWAKNRGFQEKVSTGDKQVEASFVKQKKAGWVMI